MDKEQIKQAAKEAIHEHYNCNGKYPCIQKDYCMYCNGHNTAYDCNECGADEFNEGFAKGADLRINSVWHNPGEKLEDGDYLTILRKGERKILEIAPWRNGKYQGTHHMEVYLGSIKVVMCASIGDLLPERKEDEQ